MIRLYFKIIKAQRYFIMLYMGIFLTIFIIFYAMSGTTSVEQILEKKPDIAVVDHDQSMLSASMTDYLEANNNILYHDESKEEIQDALYYAQIQVIIEIPTGFEQSFFQEQPKDLIFTQQPNAMSNVSLVQDVNTYLQTIRMLSDQEQAKSISELATDASNLMLPHVELQKIEKNTDDQGALRNGLYNYAAYISMAIIISITITSMLVVYRSDIMKRNLVSSKKGLRLNLEIAFANVLFTLCIWGILSVMIIVFSGCQLWTQTTFLYVFNLLIYTCSVSALSFFISTLLFNQRAASAISSAFSNVFTLGSAFLCGAFIPQELLPTNVLQITKFLPTYWNVKCNDALKALETMQDRQIDCLSYIGIQFLFAIVFLLLGLYVMKQKRSMYSITDEHEMK